MTIIDVISYIVKSFTHFSHLRITRHNDHDNDKPCSPVPVPPTPVFTTGTEMSYRPGPAMLAGTRLAARHVHTRHVAT